jgi:hypothetical protein
MYTITQVFNELRQEMTDNPQDFEQVSAILPMITDAIYYVNSVGLNEAPMNVLVAAKICNDVVRSGRTWDCFSALVLQGLLLTTFCRMQSEGLAK